MKKTCLVVEFWTVPMSTTWKWYPINRGCFAGLECVYILDLHVEHHTGQRC
jgi:hypothetical protein